jgi:hypothetical protein
LEGADWENDQDYAANASAWVWLDRAACRRRHQGRRGKMKCLGFSG